MYKRYLQTIAANDSPFAGTESMMFIDQSDGMILVCTTYLNRAQPNPFKVFLTPVIVKWYET